MDVVFLPPLLLLLLLPPLTIRSTLDTAFPAESKASLIMEILPLPPLPLPLLEKEWQWMI